MDLAQTRHVATKSRARLAKELSIELVRVAQRREDGTLVRVLHGNLPPVAQHPARAVVVVVGVQRAQQSKQKGFVVVPLAEIRVLVDLGADGRRASG